MFDDDFLPILIGYLKVQVGFDIWRCPKNQANDKSNGYLSDNLIFTLQSFLIVLENLNEVIHTAEETQPNGSDNHQEQIDIT